MGGCIAAGSFDNHIRVWDLRNLELHRKQRVHSDVVTSVSFSPISDDFLTSSYDGHIRLWNLKTEDLIDSFQPHDSTINDILWNQIGTHFLSAGSDRKVCSYYSINDSSVDYDGADLFQVLKHMQNNLDTLTESIRKVDERLHIQEERVKWLQSIENPIRKAYNRTNV